MKKKNIIIIIIITILVLVLFLYFFMNNKKNQVDSFSLCTIKTYDGEKISDYQNNKRAFTIEDYDTETSIKVNGRKYQHGLGFYEPGTYNVEVAKGNQKEKSKIVINKIDKNNSNNYNIYITAETLPTLFSSFDMAKLNNAHSYIWFEREGTLNIGNLKKEMPNATISDYIGNDNADTFFPEVRREVKDFVNEKLRADENAHFTVYVTAECYWLEIATIEELGLTEDRVDVVMYSCGTVDYVVNYSFLEEDTLKVFKQKKDSFQEAIEKARANLCREDTMLNYLKKDGDDYCDSDYVLINALRDNVDYYLQFPELIEFKDEKVKKQMNKANMHKIDAKQKYKELTDEQKEIFFKLVDLDKNTFDSEYFTDSNKNYLIITGTTPFNGQYLPFQYHQILKKVVEEYKNDYTILYKPHPKAIPEGENATYLEELGIKVLPGKMPMEAILFVYDNIKLGGFASSLYMSANKGDTLFFFTKDKDDLVEPLNILYDDLFSSAKFIS